MATARKPGSCLRRRFQVEGLESRCLMSGDMVLRWNTVALDAIRNDYTPGQVSEEGGPTRASRALAIVQAAVYDAVNSIDRESTPYLVDFRADPGTSVDAAVAEAGHDTLAALFPRQKAMFDTALASSLAGIPSGPAEKGIALGQFVAQQILAARQNDGSAVNPAYTPGTLPGQWRPDPLHPGQTALGPAWGQVTPFALADGSQFRAPPPPDLTSQQYTDAFNEVKALGGDGVHTPTSRTPEQTVIGIFWGYDGSPGLGVPPVEYNQIAQVIARQQGNTEVQNARLFALVNLAMADAGIVAWDTKYAYNFWRPVAAIREAAGDGNPATVADPNWTPLGAPCDNGCAMGSNFTPPFPAYTSGHATFGAALFGVLADFYGRDDIAFSWTSDEFNGVTRDQNGNVRPVVTRSFTSLSQAAYENAESRIYLGIHWAFDRDQGLRQGKQVADYTFGHVLRPLAGGADAPVGLAGFRAYDVPGQGVFLDDPQGHASHITAFDPSSLAVNARGQVVGEFPGQGVFLYNGGWDPITPFDASQVDIGANGTVVGEFPGQGVFVFNGGWSHLTRYDAGKVRIAGGTVAASFAGQGVFLYANGGWNHITSFDASALDVDAKGYFVGEFPGQGVFLYNGGWSRITPFDASEVSMADGTVAGQFAGQGVFLYANGGWNHITLFDASNLDVDAGGTFLGHFPGQGVFIYDDGGWQPLSAREQ